MGQAYISLDEGVLMKTRRFVTVVLTLFMGAWLGTTGLAKDGLQTSAPDATMHLGQHQPQSPDSAGTHFLEPDEVLVQKGGSVTFVVNGGGHGLVIHPVSKNTTRANIAADLCDGNNHETGAGNEISDRLARAAGCNGTVTTPTTIDGVDVVVTGTQNLDYAITDGKGNLIIQAGLNVNIPATPTTPAIVFVNPRLDDATHTPQIVATSGRSTGDTLNPAEISGNPAGAFLTGSAAPATPGDRIKVTFARAGRYLVICMNRAHALNDHEFGFVNVADD